MELDYRETSAADHVDFVHAGDAASKDCRHKFQHLCWRGGGDVNVRQDGVLRAAVIWHALACLRKDEKVQSCFHFWLSIMLIKYTNYSMCKNIRPVLWWAWHGPGTPWCFPGPGTGPSHRSGCRKCWQMNRTAESGFLQNIKHTAELKVIQQSFVQ